MNFKYNKAYKPLLGVALPKLEIDIKTYNQGLNEDCQIYMQYKKRTKQGFYFPYIRTSPLIQ